MTICSLIKQQVVYKKSEQQVYIILNNLLLKNSFKI